MANRGSEVDARWEWTEPSVWAERMLDALEGGVKGGKWYSLIDKVYAEETLRAAWKRVKRNRGGAGVDRETIEAFGRRAETRLARLAQRSRTTPMSPNRFNGDGSRSWEARS